MRRWRKADLQKPPPRCGRPGQPATIEQRNAVLRFLAERGAGTPLYALRHAFPELRRTDLADLHRRYRRVQQKKRKRKQSRLKWLVAGSVWAADFKERREPIEGRYGWILSIHPEQKISEPATPSTGAGTLMLASEASPNVDEARNRDSNTEHAIQNEDEKVSSSTNKMSASGQQYG